MSEVTPRDREEKLLAAIADGTAEELPTPRNRKEKLLKEIYDNGGGGGGGTSVTVDSELSDTSINPVQNKVITEQVNKLKDDLADLKNATSEFAKYGNNDNLFNGVYLTGYISGTVDDAIYYPNSNNARTIGLNVQPNTTYSVVKPSGVIDGGYYYLKVISYTDSLETVLASDDGYKYNGSICYLHASNIDDVTHYTFTTGANDKCVFITVARTLEPYVEVMKGVTTKQKYTSYDQKKLDIIYDKLFIKKDGDYVVAYHRQGEKYLGYKYGLYSAVNIGSNVWRLLDISVYDENFELLWNVNPYTSDAEGVIKISGESDYIGSVHGDESMVSYNIILDGKMVPLENIDDGYYSKIEFCVSSTICHANTQSVAFDKQKCTIITCDGVNIKNKYVPRESVTIDRLRLTTNVPKYVNETMVVSTYRDSIVNLMPSNIPTTTSGQTDLGYSEKLRDTTLSGELAEIKVKIIRAGGTDTRGRITDFGTRLKPYFDCYMNNAVSANADVFAEYEYSILIH